VLDASLKVIGTYDVLLRPNILVHTETKLTKSCKPRTWMEHPLTGFKWWSNYNRSGAIIICVRESVALATNCTSTLLDSDGKNASVVFKASNTKFLTMGIYWPSGSSVYALACRNKMQKQIEYI